MALSFLDCVQRAMNGRLDEARDVPYARNVSGGAFQYAHGSGALVSGAATVQTGLRTVYAFQATNYGSTGFATGATEVDDIIVASITTGAVSCKGVFSDFATGTRKISSSGTTTFYWVAFGA